MLNRLSEITFFWEEFHPNKDLGLVLVQEPEERDETTNH
jgi:hypothetical protein